MNGWNDCFLPDFLLLHSDTNTKEREKKRFQLALMEKEQKEQNLFKWSVMDKESAQVTATLLLKPLRIKLSASDNSSSILIGHSVEMLIKIRISPWSY